MSPFDWRRVRTAVLPGVVLSLAVGMGAQQGVEVTAHLGGKAFERAGNRAPSAALWLVPLNGRTVAAAPGATHKYSLLQKNKMFTPHLLVVPVGAVVSFPNADPFFHNVFSLFDGKRFDLGLYEAGSTKEVTFSREGVSYIFCNIHPEMSAVVVSLSTPFFSMGDVHGIFHVHDVTPGAYTLHVWVEGEEQNGLDHLTRAVEVGRVRADLGEVRLTTVPRTAAHTNKFGERYDRGESDPY